MHINVVDALEYAYLPEHLSDMSAALIFGKSFFLWKRPNIYPGTSEAITNR